jgi:hypothetical protein
MAYCNYCKTSILFGGVRDGHERYCNQRCRHNGALLKVAGHVPAESMQSEITRLHKGTCPRCGGAGPVDVHRSYRVWSAMVLTSWSTVPVLGCRSCARKSQLGGAAFCLFLGWWGIPWGLIMTPIQITKNVVGMFTGPHPARPSADLEKFVRVAIGAQLVQQSQRQRSSATPPPLPG